MIGKRIAQYQIVAKLGEGGMGVVYKAEDTRLGRFVALKFLPDEMGRDAHALERLKREARAASALNHPHICTIHDIVESEGQTFIVMELLEGTALNQRIRGGPLPIEQVLEDGIQIADALDAAHNNGVIHRDLKPANILVTKRGTVKILDFGLVKRTAHSPIAEPVGVSAMPTADRDFLTTPGAALGTVPYMSPEQARGEELDTRTDLFSFGVVLYEMSTGELPFRGNSAPVIYCNILEHDPEPPIERNAALPEKLQDVILKALEKDREQRYQSAREMLVDLRRVQRDLTGAPSSASHLAGAPSSRTGAAAASSRRLTPGGAVASAGAHKKQIWPWLAGAAVIVAVLGGILWRHVTLTTTALPFEHIAMRRLTDSGRASRSAISPDGRYVAYVDESAGLPALTLQQVAGNSVRILPPEDVEYGGVVFSPDGNSIYFVRYPRNSPQAGEMFTIPALGGNPRRVVSDVVSGPAFSHDGQRIAFIRKDTKKATSSLIVANADGSNQTVLVERPRPGGFVMGFGGRGIAPTWSADNRTIALGARVAHAGLWANLSAEVDVVDVGDGKVRVFDLKNRSVGRLAWLRDGSGLLVSGWDAGSRDLRGQIWLLMLPSGEVRRITQDLSNYALEDLSLTAAGDVIAAGVTEESAHLWIAPHGDPGRAVQITSGNRSWSNGLAWLPRGHIVAVDSQFALAIMNRDGSAPQPLVLDSHPQWGPTACGDAIMFLRLKSLEESELWRTDLDGGHSRQLTSGRLGYPTCTPDGKWAVLNTPDEKGRPTLTRISGETGERVTILMRRSFPSAVSPDGRTVAVVLEDIDPVPVRHFAVVPLAGGEPKIIARNVEFGPSTLRWTPDGKALTYSLVRQGVANLWRQPVGGGPATQLTEFKSDLIFDFCWAPDGDLLMARGPVARNVVLIRNEAH